MYVLSIVGVSVVVMMVCVGVVLSVVGELVWWCHGCFSSPIVEEDSGHLS